MKKYNELVEKIILNIGEKENISEVFHCVTRLRFYLKDKSLVNLQQIDKIPGVLGVQYKTNQLQIIIGNDVKEVYMTICDTLGIEADSQKNILNEEAKRRSGIFETLASIFLPVIPAIAGTGMIKGIMILLGYTSIDPTGGLMTMLTISGDCVFYFLPFLIAWSAAKRFKTNVPLSLALAGILLYPIMTNGLASDSTGFTLMGLPVPYVKYASSSIPIILSVWVQSYVYRYVDKVIPKVLKLVFTPMFVILIMAPITLILTGPAATYLSQGLASIVKFLFDFSPLLAGVVVGSTRPLVVLSGMHLSLGAIVLENLSSYGYDVLLPINTMGTLAMVGASLGTWYKTKDSETKTVSLSAFTSAFIGITEPCIYGLLLKFKSVLVATMLAGGIAGAWVAVGGGRSTAYVNSCILSLPVFIGEGFFYVVSGMAIAAILGFVFVQFLGVEDSKLFLKKADDRNVCSPVIGKIIDVKDIKDQVFSSEMMGTGIAFIPHNNSVYAPVSGLVTNVYPTKHAIGIMADNGLEILVHIGIDTVNLKGEHFEILVSEGQIIEQNQKIANVDFNAIKEKGFDTTTILVLIKQDKFLLKKGKSSGKVGKGDLLYSIEEKEKNEL